MKQVNVVALISHSPDGSRRYKRGEVYQISEASARRLVAAKMVRLESEPEDKKRYKRKDMRAED
jgi:nucleoside diphosphate kinase